jgi:hypothetical protein
MNDRLRKLATMKARTKDGSRDPDAQPGFKPRPFLEKIKDKNKGKKKPVKATTLPMKPRMSGNAGPVRSKDIGTLEMKPGMRKNMPANMRKMKDK